MNERYAWKPGSQIRTDANDAMEVCEKLRQSTGLSPKSLLDASRPEDAVLHGEFEWDDTVAAESYRLKQAGHIIRSIIVIREEKPDSGKEDEKIPVRVYFPTHDTEEDRRGTYESITVIARDTDMRKRLMEDCLNELRWVQNKYSALKEIVGLIEPPIRVLQQKLSEEAG